MTDSDGTAKASNGREISGQMIYDREGIWASEQDAMGRTLHRTVQTAPDSSYINIFSYYTYSDGPYKGAFLFDGVPRDPGDGIKNAEVANALRHAVKGALRNGLTTAEADQLEKLRQDIARFAVDDGQYGPNETRQIVNRAERIARGIL